MAHRIVPLYVALAALLLLGACTARSPAPPPAPPAARRAAPGIDESALDRSTRPCDDFYQYACGSWLKTTPIPGDTGSLSRVGDELSDRNEALLRAILERDASGAGDGPYARELGDFYATCMDEAAIERAGLTPLAEELAAVAEVHDAPSLAREIAHLHATSVGAAFDFDVDLDAKDATRMIAIASQGGLGLPERDFYVAKGEGEKAKLRAAYEAHVAAMLALAGDADAAKHAARVLGFETKLATASMSAVDLRDPERTYHKLDRRSLEAQAPGFAWGDYFGALGLGALDAVDVVQPDVLKEVGALTKAATMEDWRLYLRWRLLDAHAPALASRFVVERLKWSQALTGVQDVAPRWKRCVRIADRLMGEALAQPFVKETLGADGKALALEMVRQVEESMRADLLRAAWMDEPTRARAVDKLARVTHKVAFPDVWQSYDGLAIDRTSYFRNRANGYAFDVRRRLSRAGKPVDRQEWLVTPPTVGAFYLPVRNEATFPAGILQPPLFAVGQPRAMSYGGIGVTIGHEISHGFDDEGRHYDGEGNLREAWSPSVAAAFDERAACFVKQYAAYAPAEGQHVDGKLTLGENIADNGGLRLAYAAFERDRAAHPAREADSRDDAQLFFLSYAQAWCEALRPELLRVMLASDPHAPAHFRVNGSVSNMKEFAAAFACKPGDAMVRAERCEIW